MTFLRHLAAVVLTVAVIIGLGMLWAHTSGGGTGPGSAFGPAPSREALVRLGQLKGGPITVGPIGGGPGGGFQLGDTGNLIRTCVVEAMLATVVITVSAARRRRRWARRQARARGRTVSLR